MSEEHIVRYTLEEVRKLKSQTDWARIEADEAAGIEPPFDEDDFEVDWSSAVLVDGLNKKPISLRVDPDVLEFFRKGGSGYQTKINAVLRAYMKAQQKQR